MEERRLLEALEQRAVAQVALALEEPRVAVAAAVLARALAAAQSVQAARRLGTQARTTLAVVAVRYRKRQRQRGRSSGWCGLLGVVAERATLRGAGEAR